jgi:hypothetical protein
MFLRVKNASPSPNDDVRFFLTSPSGNVTWVKGSPFGRSFRGQSLPLGEGGDWNATGVWTSGPESCTLTKKVFVGPDSYNTTILSFDQTSGGMTQTITVPDYRYEEGTVDAILLDPAGAQGNTSLMLSLGSVFATVRMDYDSYVVPGKSYSVSASFYNNYITEVNASLSVRLTTRVKIPVSSSPPVTAEYKPEVLKIETDIKIDRISSQAAWLNFTLPGPHSLAAGGWFPVRPGVFSMAYTLATSMDRNVTSIVRPIHIMPEGTAGMPISTKSVHAASFNGVTILGLSAPLTMTHGVLATLATSIRGVSVYHSQDVYFTMDDPELKVAYRNDTFIVLEARASSKNGMRSVEFLNSTDGTNWTRICTDTTPADGWRCEWNITKLVPGKHRLSATATDAIGIAKNAMITVEVAAPPGFIERVIFPWWWVGAIAIAGIAVVGTRRLIYAANPLLLKEKVLRSTLAKGDLDGFRRELAESVGMLTDRYAGAPLRSTCDLTTYAQGLRSKGVMTREVSTIVRRSLEWAFGRGMMTRRDGQEMYVLYLKYKEFLKRHPKRPEAS